MANPRVAASSYYNERTQHIPKLKYRNTLPEPSPLENTEPENSFYASETDTQPSEPTSPVESEFEQSIQPSQPPSSIPPPRSSSDSRGLSRSQYNRQSVQSEAKSTKSTKSKKSSSVFKFFAVKEPSAQALLDYQEAIVKQQAASDGKVRVAGLPMVSSKQLPPDVPKVNSKWDGVPEAIKERERTVRASKRQSIQPLRSAMGLLPNRSDTSSNRDSVNPKDGYNSSKSASSLISFTSTSSYGEDFSHLASLINIEDQVEKNATAIGFPSVTQSAPSSKDAVPRGIAKTASKDKPTRPGTSREASVENYKILGLPVPALAPAPEPITRSTALSSHAPDNKSSHNSPNLPSPVKVLPAFETIKSHSKTHQTIKATVVEIHANEPTSNQSSTTASTPNSINTPLEALRRARLVISESFDSSQEDTVHDHDHNTQIYSRPVAKALSSPGLPHSRLPVRIGPGMDEYFVPLSAAFPAGDTQRRPRVTVDYTRMQDSRGERRGKGASKDRNVAPWDSP